MVERWDNPDAVFLKLRDITIGRPCDYSGIRDRQQLDEVGRIQWPYLPGSLLEANRSLFADGIFPTPDGRARFIFEEPQVCPALPSSEFPFIALTGRDSIALFQTNTRTGLVPGLMKMARAKLYVRLNPEDMAELELRDGDQVEISSQYGTVHAGALASEGLQRKQLYLPMHYLESNLAAMPSFDPYSRQPSFKYTVVQVKKAVLVPSDASALV